MQKDLFTPSDLIKLEGGRGKTCTKCKEHLPVSFFPSSPDKLYKVNGKTNFEGIGNRSDPWSYCPENIRVAHHKLSTSKN